MTDHYLRSRELLDEAEQLRLEVDEQYRQAVPDKRVVADRFDRMRFALDRAKVHAQLAEVQALQDVSMMGAGR